MRTNNHKLSQANGGKAGLCPKCKERALLPAQVNYRAVLDHDGRVYEIKVPNLNVLRCRRCRNIVLPDEASDRLTENLRTQAGLMSPAEIAMNRKRLGLSQKELAVMMGVAPETVCRWESGGQIQQRVMNEFLLAFFHVPGLRDYLAQRRYLTPTQSSSSSWKGVRILPPANRR